MEETPPGGRKTGEEGSEDRESVDREYTTVDKDENVEWSVDDGFKEAEDVVNSVEDRGDIERNPRRGHPGEDMCAEAVARGCGRKHGKYKGAHVQEKE